ncbi:MAG: xanthine dehydrogenase family protein subunit M [Anaerolineales bacterium]|nr:xanthine dehydrogenase family protein subunit M [Anaerolineales bacterium]
MTIDAHPELPEFDYLRPATLMEASQFLAQHSGEARPLLGGTDIFVRMRDGLWHDKYLVDVKHLDGSDALVFDPQEGLTLGAAVNMNRVIASAEVQQHYQLLAEACRSVASYQLRTRATVVGNICNASPAGDTIGACLALKGVLTVHGLGGFRQVPLATFFLGPGKTILEAGDIVTAIHFPRPPHGATGTYLKLGRNKLSDLSIVGVTVYGYPDASAASGYRFCIALASVAPVPLLVPSAAEHLASKPTTPKTFKQAAHLAQEACSPIDDVRGGARYRKAMVRNLTEKALGITWERLGQV